MPEIIKLGTLAPKSTPYGKVFKVWAEDVARKSLGMCEIQFFFNGQPSEEERLERAQQRAREQGLHGAAVLRGAPGLAGLQPAAVIDLGPALLLGPAAKLQEPTALRGQRVGCAQDCAELAERLRALGAQVVPLVPGVPVPDGLAAIGGGAAALGALGRSAQGYALLEAELGRAGCAIVLFDEVLAARPTTEQAALRELLTGAAASEAVVAANDRALALLRRLYRTLRPAAPAAWAPAGATVEPSAATAAPSAETAEPSAATAEPSAATAAPRPGRTPKAPGERTRGRGR